MINVLLPVDNPSEEWQLKSSPPGEWSRFLRHLRFRARVESLMRMKEAKTPSPGEPSEVFFAYGILDDAAEYVDPNSGADEDLWKTLVTITAIQTEGPPFQSLNHRSIDAVLRNGGESMRFLPSEPSQQFVLTFVDVLISRFQLLSFSQRFLAYLKLCGYSNGEVARKFRIEEASVEKELQAIKMTWIRY